MLFRPILCAASLTLFSLYLIGCDDQDSLSYMSLNQETTHPHQDIELAPQAIPWDDVSSESQVNSQILVDSYLSQRDMSHTIEQTFPAASECLECGRETGFLPTPTLSLDSITELDHKPSSFLSISWTPSEGATYYQLTITRISNQDQTQSESILKTTEIEVELGVEHYHQYLLYVVAHNEQNKSYSVASEPLLIDCQEECSLVDFP
jgi:hypothetical protein